MPQWKSRRLVATESGRFKVMMQGQKGPELVCPDGNRVDITNRLGQHQLLWKCIGCPGGRCHYKLCTSKTLDRQAVLWCYFCMYNEQLWEQEGKRVLPECELWFMALLVMAGMDCDFCLQVIPPFWHQPMDFYSLSTGVFVQVDGKCHWVGMRGLSRDEVLAEDMQQNKAALLTGARLVRVHERDIDTDASVLAALQAAAQGYSVVLTPAYATEQYHLYGRNVAYWQALLATVTNCCYDKDGHGNYRFWLM